MSQRQKAKTLLGKYSSKMLNGSNSSKNNINDEQDEDQLDNSDDDATEAIEKKQSSSGKFLKNSKTIKPGSQPGATGSGKESPRNLMSKCKNLCKSETAKTIRDEVNKLKGTIEKYTLKHFTHSTSKVYNDNSFCSDKTAKVEEEDQLEEEEEEEEEEEDELPVPPPKPSRHKNVNRHRSPELETEEKGSKHSKQQKNVPKQAEAKPVPPKRPPPPRPVSPSLLNKVANKKSSSGNNMMAGGKTTSRDRSESPPAAKAVVKSKKAAAATADNLPHRPPLPPRPKGKEAVSKRRECQQIEELGSDIYEFEVVQKSNQRGKPGVAVSRPKVGGVVSSSADKNAKSKSSSSRAHESDSMTFSSVSVGSFTTRSPKPRKRHNGK